MKICLRVRESPRESFDWEHTAPALCISRADDCQLVFRGSIAEIVSARHIQIELSSKGATVRDLGSTNGTYLYGARLTAPAHLRKGDQLQLGLAGPRIEVRSLDLQGAESAATIAVPPCGRTSASLGVALRRPWLIAAGAGLAAVVALCVFFVAMRSRHATSTTTAGQTGTENAKPVTSAAPAVEATPSNDDRPEAPPSKPGPQAANEESSREAAASERIGRLISDQDVLLREVDGQWRRVPSQETVNAGERLIALPTYRPIMAMTNGMTLRLLGGAMLSVSPPKDDGGARIHLLSGRMLLLTATSSAAKIHLQVGDYRGTLEFGGDEAALAVEVRRLRSEGSDPEQQVAPTAVDLYLSRGEATWVDEQGRSEKLSGRSHRSLGDGKRASQPVEALPDWMEASKLNPTERRASTEIEGVLRPEQPAGPALAELVAHRKIENSLLAVQSLAMVDDFKPILPLLNDPEFHIAWTSQIESLRTALASSPQSATLLRKAFEAVRGRELGDQLYRMLWGYTSEQLEEGAAAQLIDWLDAPDEQLDFRVLSFWNLHHITGLRLNYQPADPEKKRRTSIQHWKQKLESGLLVPTANYIRPSGAVGAKI